MHGLFLHIGNIRFIGPELSANVTHASLCIAYCASNKLSTASLLEPEGSGWVSKLGVNFMSKKTSRVSRRSFVALVTGAAASAMIASPAKAQTYTGRTDSDPSDGSGYGRTGITDSDSNDRASYGRGGSRTSGLTDSDSGPNADTAGNGRGSRNSGLTDSDSGTNSDSPGRGRGSSTGYTDSDPSDGGGRGRSGLTDSDDSDRASYGRGRGTGR